MNANAEMTATVSALGRTLVTAVSSDIAEVMMGRGIASRLPREPHAVDVADVLETVDRAHAGLARAQHDRRLANGEAGAHRPGQRDRLREIHRIGFREEHDGVAVEQPHAAG